MTDDAPGAREGEVAAIIKQKVAPAERDAYEAWLKEIIPVASRAPGHRNVNVIRPTGASGEYTIVLHFDTVENLGRWLESDERRRLVDKALFDLDFKEEIEIRTGLEFWFTPPTAGAPRAKPYKQFLITLSVIYPLTLIVPLLLQPVWRDLPAVNFLLVRQLIADALIVGSITYLIMPRYVRLVAKWLYR